MYMSNYGAFIHDVFRMLKCPNGINLLVPNINTSLNIHCTFEILNYQRGAASRDPETQRGRFMFELIDSVAIYDPETEA